MCEGRVFGMQMENAAGARRILWQSQPSLTGNCAVSWIPTGVNDPDSADIDAAVAVACETQSAILDRSGHVVFSVPSALRGSVLFAEWDTSGALLAVVHAGEGRVSLLSAVTRQVSVIDTDFTNITLLTWSPDTSHPKFFIAPLKGAGKLVSLRDARHVSEGISSITVTGRVKASVVSTAAWSPDGSLFALGGADGILTVHDSNGALLASASTAFAGAFAGAVFDPSHIWSHPLLLAVRVNSTPGIAVFDVRSVHEALGSGSGRPELQRPIAQPRIVQFNGATGNALAHSWLPQGSRLVAAFPDGSIAAVTVGAADRPDVPLWRGTLLPGLVAPPTPSWRSAASIGDTTMSLAAAAGSTGSIAIGHHNSVWIFNSPTDELLVETGAIHHGTAYVDFECEPTTLASDVCGLQWDPSGRLVAVATATSGVVCILGSVPLVATASPEGHVVTMSGPRELFIISDVSRSHNISRHVVVELPVEIPSLLAYAGAYIAAAHGNRVTYLRVSGSGQNCAISLIEERTYSGVVVAVFLTQRGAASILSKDGHLVVHRLGVRAPSRVMPEEDTLVEPTSVGESDKTVTVTAAALRADLLYYGTADGIVRIFSLSAWADVAGAEFRSQGDAGAVIMVSPNASSTRAIVVLAPRGKSDGNALCTTVLFNPIDNRALPLPVSPMFTPQHVLWDALDGCIFVIIAFDGGVRTFFYATESLTGPAIHELGEIEICSNGDMAVAPRSTMLPQHANVLDLRNGSLLLMAPDATAVCGAIPVDFILATHDAIAPSTKILQVLRLDDGSELERPGDRLRRRFLPPAPSERSVLRRAFGQFVALARLQAAWDVAEALEAVDQEIEINSPAGGFLPIEDSRPQWLALAGRAMELLDVETAVRVYRRIGNTVMVAELSALDPIAERTALAGHVAMLFRDADLAQELFLLSESAPLFALEMRVALRQWDIAVRLAQTLSPNDVPGLSVELALAYEARAEYGQAAMAFEVASQHAVAALETAVPTSKLAALFESVRVKAVGGIARCALRSGNVRRGIEILLAVDGDTTLLLQCARILEDLHQLAEAAALYQRASMCEKAVSLFLKTGANGLAAASPLMRLIDNPRLLTTFARAKAAAKEYVEAAAAFERAGEWDSAVKLYIENIRDIPRARSLVRATRNVEAAALLAAHCIATRDVGDGVEFLVTAKRIDDAFSLAEKHGEMNSVVRALRFAAAIDAGNVDTLAASAVLPRAGSGAPLAVVDRTPSAEAEAVIAATRLVPAEAVRAARYFEARGDSPAAAALFAEAGRADDAMRLYLGAGDAFLDEAIAVAGSARDDAVTRRLVEHLMGESTGATPPRDPRYLFKLHMALGDTPAAGRTALVIARQEQELGNYKVAHAILFDAYEAIVRAGGHVPNELLGALALLHSYLLIRRLVRLERHLDAARLTLRVAASVSLFPVHAVPILTSAVIECARAGLRRAAFEHACTLMRPENRSAVEEKFRRKIEALVRRAPTDDDEPEPLTPCPYCETPTAAYALACNACQSTIPFCIATGRHMTPESVVQCSACRFPAFAEPFTALLVDGDSCPMCGVKAPVSLPVENARALLRRS